MKNLSPLRILGGVALALLLAYIYLHYFACIGISCDPEFNRVRVWATSSTGVAYPADWIFQEELTYDASGAQIVYRGASLMPRAQVNLAAPENKIFVGAHRASVCADVPDATKCAGGGKGDKIPLTFTRSKNSYVLDVFDQIVERWQAKR